MATTVYNRLKESAPVQWFLKHSGIGRLRTHIRWFGFYDGFRILWRKWRRISEPLSIQNSFLKAPVFLRATTSDPYIYAEVLHDRAYGTNLPPTAKLIIDAGANIGLSSVFFSNHYPEAQVVAIEPAESNMAVLRRNVSAYPGIDSKLAALWPISGPLCLVDSHAEAWAIQVQPCKPEEADFQGITIPDLLKEYQATRIDLLKIDIEGAEWPLLFHAPTDWLDTVDCLMIELHEPTNKKISFDHVVQLLARYGLKLAHTNGGNFAFSR